MKLNNVEKLSREEKIKLLEDIQAGKLTIEDVDPNVYVIETFLDLMKLASNPNISNISTVARGRMKIFFDELKKRANQ